MPMLLTDTKSVWVILSGKVDIFAVEAAKGKLVGARSHIFRAEEGDALFSVRHNGERGRPVLLASGIAGTRLLKLEQSQVRKLAGEPARKKEIAALIDSWINRLSSGLCKQIPPKQFVRLEAGKESLLEEKSSARPEAGVVWVKFLEGAARFMGLEQLLVTGDVFTPVSSRSWLVGASPGKLSVINTETFLREDPSWSNLERFHRLAIDCVVLNKRETEKKEQERLKAKEENDRKSLKNALTTLSAVLRTGPSEPVISGEGGALFQACRLVGKALEITVKQSPEAKKGVKEESLRSIALVSRMRLRKVALTDNWWRKDNGPMLAFMKESKLPVALLPVSAACYIAHDPVKETKTKVTAEVASTLDDFAYIFYPSFHDGVLKAMELAKFGIRGCRKDLAAVILIGVLGGLLQLLLPVLTGTIFDTIIPNAERGGLLQIVLILLASALGIGVFNLTQAIASLRIDTKSNNTIQSGVWDRLMSLPAPFFRKYSAGDLSQRAMGINAISKIVSGTVIGSALQAIFSIFNLALLFYYSW